MKKSELKNGAILETRNGHKYLKVDDTLIDINIVDGIAGFMELKEYDKNLFCTSSPEWDIIKVHNDVNNPYGGIAKSILEVCAFNRWTWERAETPKLTDDERSFLKSLNPKWEWIARDEDGRLVLYQQIKPHKEEDVGIWFNKLTSRMLKDLIKDDMFSFIKWEDKEPYNIQELLKGEPDE